MEQPALNGTFRYILNFSNLLNRQLIVVIQHQRRPLLRGKLIQHFQNDTAEVLLIHRLIRYKLLTILYRKIQNGNAVLIFFCQRFVFVPAFLLAEKTGTLVVSDLLHPCNKSRRLLQCADGVNDLNKSLLRDLASGIFIPAGLQGKEIDVIIKRVEQIVYGAGIPCLSGSHQRNQFFSLHRASSGAAFFILYHVALNL